MLRERPSFNASIGTGVPLPCGDGPGLGVVSPAPPLPERVRGGGPIGALHDRRPTASVTWATTQLITLITIVGLALRLAAARGDLWLDEIWSSILANHTDTFADIVFALPHDNNHVLNSLWLKLVGPTPPPLLARCPAVLFGTLCVPVAARIGARIGPVAAVAAATIVAIDYTFVQFGSEARGYSGLILAILVSIDALENILDGVEPRRNQIVFALAVTFGTLSHLIMLEATGILCAVAALRLWQEAHRREAHRRGDELPRFGAILVAATVGTVPVLTCFVISLLSGPLHIGLSTPFSVRLFADGLGGMVRATTGLPDATNTAVLLLLACGSIVAALVFVPPQRRVLPALTLLGLPALHAALHLPNQQYSRFHLVTAVCLAVFGAEIWARAWTKGGAPRVLAVVVALGFVAGQGAHVASFLTMGRGHFAEAVAAISREESTRLSVLPPVAAPETAAVIRWYATLAGRKTDVRLVPTADLCATPPAWLLIVHRPDDPADVDAATRLRSTACPTQFAVFETFPAYGMSGFSWTLFRHR